MATRSLPPIEALELAALEWEARAESERRRQAAAEQERMASVARTEKLWRSYRDDPVAWVHDMIDWRDDEGPTAYQDEIMAALPIHKRVAVRGPHGLGKTAMESWVCLWYALTRDGDDWKIPTAAGVWRQLTRYLWPEIRKWARKLKWDKLGRAPFDSRTELQMLGLKLRTGEAFAVASDKPDLIEGAHADRLLYLFDESKAIADATFDAAEGALGGPGEVFALAASTPGDPRGRFYDIHARKPGFEDWWTRHVTMEEVVRAGRMSEAWAEQRRRQWGEKSAVYQNRVRGEFAASDEDGIIPLAWIEIANERWREWDDAGRPLEGKTFVGVGCDVGGGSATGDKTTFALRYDLVVTELRKWQRAQPMETAGRLVGIVEALGGKAIVDVIGIGAGIVSRLRELKIAVEAFNAAEGAYVIGPGGKKIPIMDRSNELGFTNMRSAAWWSLREQLDPDGGDPIALPPDDDLTGDLTAPHWRVISGGKIQVESKDELKKPDRLGRSTDDGDSVVQVMFEPPQPKRRGWGAV